MKKSVLVAAVFAIFAVAPAAAQNIGSPQETTPAITEGSNVNITLVSQDPQVAQPGEYVDLRFKIANRGSQDADDTRVTLLQSFPFSLDPDVSATRDLGDLRAGSVNDNSYFVEYRVRVNETAVESETPIEVRYSTQAGDVSVTREFDVSVNDVGTDFELSAGKTSNTRIGLNLDNTGDQPAQSVHLVLPDQEDLSKKGINTKVIGSSEPGSNTDVSFPVSEVKAQEKYRLEIHYTDQNGVRRELVRNIQISDIQVKPVDVTLQSLAGSEATFAVVNTGTGQISSVTTTARPETARVTGSNTNVLGNLNAGDYTLATFDFNTTPSRPRIQVKYTDNSGIRRSTSRTVEISEPAQTTESRTEYTSQGSDDSGNSSLTYIGIGVAGLLSVVAYVLYRRRKGN
jgi:hypothetical protein